MKGKTVAVTWNSLSVTAEVPLENLAVTMPIAVEAKLPWADGRKAQDIAILGFMKEIGDHNNIIP
jgi:hypothetical protein